jgi:hypothetical protein
MDTPTLVAVSSLGGVFLGVIGSIATTWMNKRFEDRRHLRQLALNLGLENFKISMTEAVRKAGLGKGTTLPPLDDHILHMLCLADLIDRTGTKAESIRKLLSSTRKLSGEMSNYYDTEDPLSHRRGPQ